MWGRSFLFASGFLVIDFLVFWAIYVVFALFVKQFGFSDALVAGGNNILARTISFQWPLQFLALAGLRYTDLHRIYPCIAIASILALVAGAFLMSLGRGIPSIATMFGISFESKVLGPGIALVFSSLIAWIIAVPLAKKVLS